MAMSFESFDEQSSRPQNLATEISNPLVLDSTILKSKDDFRWMDNGNCQTETDRQIFFPIIGGRMDIGKEICRLCVVKDECLEYALVNNINEGIWGGTSGRERIVLKRQIKKNSIHQ